MCAHAHAHREASDMAVSIMAAPARVCVLRLCLLGGILQVLVQGEGKTSGMFLSLFLFWRFWQSADITI